MSSEMQVPARGEGAYAVVPIDQVMPSPTNPRKAYDKPALDELAESIREHGVLQPILLRPWPAGRKPPKDLPAASFELVVGERRLRASRLAGLEVIPAIVRQMTDTEMVERQMVENLQRADLHPLEEAEGYRQLMAKGHDVARIAERTGRSVGYVYDRVKLLSLTKAAQKDFLEGRIAVGHAIILARLSPKDQARAMDGTAAGGLWDDERTLFDPDDRHDHYKEYHYKARTARELQAWVDQHVKLEQAELDPMLFPESVVSLTEARTAQEKVVRITHDQITPEEAKDGPRPILGRSWKRADGQRGSKTCDHSVLGQIVIGAGRGQVLRVCTDKKRCAVHWGDEIKARSAREREVQKEAGTGEDREALRRRKEEAARGRQKAEEDRWEKALPAIFGALAAAIKRAPAGAGGLLGQRVQMVVADQTYLSPERKKLVGLVPPGKTAEDLVRHVAFVDFLDDSRYFNMKDLVADVKNLGVDVQKILASVAPPAEAAPTKKAGKAKAAKKAAKKRA